METKIDDFDLGNFLMYKSVLVLLGLKCSTKRPFFPYNSIDTNITTWSQGESHMTRCIPDHIICVHHVHWGRFVAI